jgi:hypothetical protein
MKNTAQHSTAQHDTSHHSTTQHSTSHHITSADSTAHHSTAQHITAHQRTAQHSISYRSQPYAAEHPCTHAPTQLLGQQRLLGSVHLREEHVGLVRGVAGAGEQEEGSDLLAVVAPVLAERETETDNECV